MVSSHKLSGQDGEGDMMECGPAGSCVSERDVAVRIKKFSGATKLKG